jgi:subfamily B ATP-binding cassette protein MsbA
MVHFRTFALRMLRRPVALALAVVFAFVSAGSLGGGLLGLPVILRSILGDESGGLRATAAAGLQRLPSWASARLGDRWIEALPAGRLESVAWLVAGLVALTFIGATANFLHAYFSLTVTTRVVADVRLDLFRRVIHFPLGSLRGRVGDTISRIVNDTNVLLAGLGALLSKALAQATKSLAALLVALVIEWRLAIAAIVLAPVLYAIIRKLGKRVRRASRGAMQAQARLLEVATEALQGVRVVKVSTAERYEVGRFRRENRAVVREQFRARSARALAGPLTESLAICAIAALTLVAAWAIIDGRIQTAAFISTLAALGVAGSALKPLTGIVQEIQTSEAAAQRIAELMSEPVEPARRHAADRAPTLARHARSIAFDRVTLRYPGSEAAAIDGVSIEIAHGETIAFVGPNGSGKTSLLSLVPRLFAPTSGRVLIDGVDIAGVSLSSLRSQIAVVTQEVVLFQGSITDNIAYGVAGASRERILEAARRAGADEFIRARPGGYDARVGEQGASLSGGQRQRVAIARAILRDPAILILDEATSMIDTESERQIGETLAAFSRGRTCLVVAHRLSTVVSADRIIVLQNGRVADVGRHSELLERSPLYRQLAGAHLISRPEPVA